MRRLLDIDNPVMRLVIKLFDCMVLSVLWTVFSLPVITMGASSTALYSAVYHHIRKDEGYLWKSFWNAFKENFKRSTLAWLPMLAMILFLIYDVMALHVLIKNGNPFGRLFGIILVLLFVGLVWAVYLAAYCARFKGTVKEVLKYSFFLMMSHPLRAIGVMIAVVGSIALILVVPGLAVMLPALSFLVSSILIEQVFAMHLRPEDQEDVNEGEENRDA
ncbi:MAG: YesL family protein [Lachnospiraceae bacterium]|nr:YesL family protein [Lachnospiraceae bacterium]MBP5750416.1 YesL family protein [Bacillota bacterium]